MKTFYHKVTKNPAVFADDAAIADWPEYQEAMPAPTEEEVRAERDVLLLASDAEWAKCTGMSFNMSHADWQANTHCQQWATYRQNLRDLPDQDGFPHNITWPTKPAS